MQEIICDSLKFQLILQLPNLSSCFLIFLKKHYLKYSSGTEFMGSVMV